MVRQRDKEERYSQWKLGRVAWEEYRLTAQTCRDAIRVARAQVELNLLRDVKNIKTGFYRFIRQKAQAKENPPL